MIKKVLCLMILAAMLVLPAAAANVTYPQDYYDLQNKQYQILHPVGIGFLSNTTYDMRWTVTNAGMSGDAGEVIFLELRRQTILMEKQNELLAEQNELFRNQSKFAISCQPEGYYWPNQTQNMSVAISS